MLRVYLFGTPRIELNQARVEISRRKAIALLAYLAVTGQPHSRESLAALLWPEADQGRAFAYLRTALWTLHKALGEDWLDAGGDAVGLRPGGGWWLDVARFRTLLKEDPASQAADVLAEAATLYQDDFMAGFTLPDAPDFDEWQFFVAEELRRTMGTALQALAGQLVAGGDPGAAIPYARRWLALDTLDEAAHRQLMALYHATGQRAAALRQYQECASLLRDELGVEPEPDTTALYESIQAARVPATPAETLPTPATPLIGRQRELDEIHARLSGDDCRLLTVIGQGGIGKTRLALQAAADLSPGYADGAVFVPLAPVTAAEYLVSALADALHFKATRQGEPRSQLWSYLRRKHMLLVLDNFEHLLDGADLIASLLSFAPRVDVLVTSRERLNLREEWLYEIHGLSFPQNGETTGLEAYDAVALFVHSAQRVRPGFALDAATRPAVARICRLVDGMPLAVELAAAWLQVLSPQEIAEEIERSLDFLTASLRNLPPRHRSIRAVFESSWERLDPAQARVLSRLSIFRGRFTREAAHAVADAPLTVLLALAGKSLLHRLPDGRFHIHELLRQYAGEKLDATPVERDRTHRAYVTYYVHTLRGLEPRLKGPDQIDVLDQIKDEIDNIRAAWMLAVSQRDAAGLSGLLTGLRLFYIMRPRLQESKEMFGGTVDYLKDAGLTAEEQIVLAQVKTVLAMTYRVLGRGPLAADLFHEAYPVLSQLDARDHPDAAITFNVLSTLANWPLHDSDTAERMARRAIELFEAQGNSWGIAWGYQNLGDVAHVNIRYAESGAFYQRALDISRAIGDRWMSGVALKALGEVAYSLGQYAEAERLYREGLVLSETIGDDNEIAFTLDRLANLVSIQGRHAEAEALIGQALQLGHQLGDPYKIASNLFNLAEIAYARRDYAASAQHCRESLTYFAEAGSLHMAAWLRIHQSRIALAQGDAAEAATLAEMALSVLDPEVEPWGQSVAFYCLGEAALAQGDRAVARDHLRIAVAIAARCQSVMLLTRFLIGVARLWARTGRAEPAIEILACVQNHPATWREARERAAELAGSIAANLPARTVRAAEQRGRGRTLDEVVALALADD
jgi:predicted ATPase/DNA-binding SARP family transcriptional activator